GTEKPVELSDPHTNCTVHQSKDQPLPAVPEEMLGLLTLNKFRSRCERGCFNKPMLLPRGLAVLTPRRSEAQPRPNGTRSSRPKTSATLGSAGPLSDRSRGQPLTCLSKCGYLLIPCPLGAVFGVA